MKKIALFELVKSMTKGEKRYFNRFAQRHVLGERNQYFLLYTAIAEQERYDEVEIKKQFPEITQFSVHKNYLYNLLLRSLRSYALETKREVKLRAQLDYIEILFARGLLDQCTDLIKKLKKGIVKSESVHFFPELYKWERKVLKAQAPVELPARLTELAAERVDQQRRLTTEMDLMDRYDQMIALLRQSQRGDNKQSVKAALHILQDPLIQTAPSEMTFLAQQAWLYIHAYGHQMKEDFHAAYPFYLQILELWTDSPARISAQVETYSRILATYLNICHLTNQHGDFATMVHRIRSLPNLSTDIQAKVFSMTYNLELLYYMNYGLFEKAQNLIPELEAGLNKFHDKIDTNQLLVYYYNIAVLFFVQEDHSRALGFVNRIFAEPKSRAPHPFVRFAGILNMVLHVELGNEDLLPHLIRAFTRSQKGADKLNSLETKVIQLLRNLERQLDQRARTLLFREFESEMEALYKVHGPRMLGLAELASWAESKANRRTIVEVIEEKTAAWHKLISGK